MIEMFSALSDVVDYGDCYKDKISKVVMDHWDKVGPAWRRVTLGCHTMLINCADLDCDTLEFRPEFKAVLTAKDPTP